MFQKSRTIGICSTNDCCHGYWPASLRSRRGDWKPALISSMIACCCSLAVSHCRYCQAASLFSERALIPEPWQPYIAAWLCGPFGDGANPILPTTNEPAGSSAAPPKSGTQFSAIAVLPWTMAAKRSLIVQLALAGSTLLSSATIARIISNAATASGLLTYPSAVYVVGSHSSPPLPHMMGSQSEVIQSPVRAPWKAMPNMPSLVNVLAISRSSSQVSGGL